MIDWLTKLPDGMLGVLLAGSSWFSFNYAVLAERAMERDLARPAMSACLNHLDGQEESRMVPRSGIGELLGMPELDEIEAHLVEGMLPAVLTDAQKAARCACAVASAPKLRLDYAVHTATFRIVPVDGVSAFREYAIEASSSPVCTAGG